jgi:effector-binding domain-containing protein
MILLATMKRRLVLGIRKIGSYEELPMLFNELNEYAESIGMTFVGPAISVFHEMSAERAAIAARERKAHLECCYPIPERVKGDGRIECYILPGGEMAKTIYTGQYSGRESAYSELNDWMKSSGKKINGFFREAFLSGPLFSANEMTIEISVMVK